MEEPIKKYLLLVHVGYKNAPKRINAHKLNLVKSLIEQVKHEPGTKVLLFAGESPRDEPTEDTLKLRTEVEKLVHDEIPYGRRKIIRAKEIKQAGKKLIGGTAVHFHQVPGEIDSNEPMRQDIENLRTEMQSWNHDLGVEIDYFGDYIDQCGITNALRLADFLETKLNTPVKKIVAGGTRGVGRTAKETVNAIRNGGTTHTLEELNLPKRIKRNKELSDNYREIIEIPAALLKLAEEEEE